MLYSIMLYSILTQCGISVKFEIDLTGLESLSGLFLEIHFMGEWEWAWGEWGAEMAWGWQ